MRKVYLSAIIMIICLCMPWGCGQQKEDFVPEGEELTENPFEQEKDEQKTMVMGTISHGVLWQDNNTYCLTYEGGEMEIPYFMQASGIAGNCGFLLFIDGIPQPYKVKGVHTDYQYMHRFELEEDKDETYIFQFTPVTGKEGGQLSVCIASITNPGFMPDMKDTFSYGHFHKALEAVYPIMFQADAEPDTALSEKTSGKNREVIQNLSAEETEINQDFIKELEEETQSKITDLDKDVETRLYVSGKSMLLAETADISGKETIHIKYIITGHPGAKYKTVFYLNHEPLAYNGEDSFLSVLKSGQVGVIEFDINAAALENNTFYAISVPCNSADYPNDVLMMYKSNSIFFYSASELEESGKDAGQENDNRPENAGSDNSDAPENTVVVQPNSPEQGGIEPNPIPEDDRNPLDSALVQTGLNQFQGMDEIQYAGDNKILVFADKIYLYELTGQKVIAETEYPDSNGKYGNLKTWITDNGYVIAYETFSQAQESETDTTEIVGFDGGKVAGSFHIMYAYYDANLCIDKTIDVTALGTGAVFIHKTAPSGDGSRIVVCEPGKGISTYDVNTLTKIEVLSVDGEDNAGLCSVNQVAFAENDSRIVFLGDCIENGEGNKCYGSVKTDGSDLSVHKGSTFEIMNVFTEHTIFSEELPDDRVSGQVWVYYPSKEHTQIIQMSEKMESNFVWGSDKGNYFVTAVENKNIGWVLRLYDIRTAELVSTKLYELENTDAYRDPHICYLEDLQTAVLLQRPYGDNEQFKAGIVSFR